MKRALLISFLLLLVTVILAGCSFAKSDKVTLRWAIPDDPESLNPQKMSSTYTLSVADQIYEGLCSISADNKIVAAGAERWERSADGLTYKFFLRKDARWSNGDPVIAQDYVYSWRAGANPKYASEAAYMLYFIKNAQAYNEGKAKPEQMGVRALDDYTLEVQLEHPAEFFLRLTAFHTYFPMDSKVATKNPDWANEVRTMVANGPFKVNDWDHNAKIILVANDQYWDKSAVKLKKIEIYMVDKDSTAMTMIENDQLDISDTLPPDSEYKRLMQSGKIKIYPFMNTNYLAFNVHNKPLDDARVRKALAYAIDCKSLLQDSLELGATKLAYAWVPYGIPDVTANPDFRTVGGTFYKFDPEQARKLLAEAGFPNGKSFPTLTYLYGGTQGKTKLYAEMMQEMWKKNVGVNVKLVNQEWKVYNKSRDELQYDICTNSWVGDYLDPMTYMEVLMTSSGTNNVSRWSNDKYDQLIETARGSLDNAERMSSMHAAEAIIFEDMPITPYAISMNRIMDSGKVHGVIRDASGKTLMKQAYKE